MFARVDLSWIPNLVAVAVAVAVLAAAVLVYVVAAEDATVLVYVVVDAAAAAALVAAVLAGAKSATKNPLVGFHVHGRRMTVALAKVQPLGGGVVVVGIFSIPIAMLGVGCTIQKI